MGELLNLTREVLDRARASRDARFDGKFFIAVTSTKIYCRPVCPARTSKDCNVRYYATAAEASEAGFRPCLRCRPEAAPGSPAWVGTSAVVRRALRLIQEGALDSGSIDELANRLGIGGRHLTRLFAQHVGASPAALGHTRRLHFAKRLLDDTHLSVTDIALASGFGSVRRFNDAFLACYRRSPSKLRKFRPANGESHDAGIVLRLAYRPPYDWLHLQAFLSKRAIHGVEVIEDTSYWRAIRTASGHALIRVRPVPGADSLELRIRGAQPTDLLPVLTAARRVFDLGADPARIAVALGGDPLLRPLIQRRPGLRIPGVWEPFECCVRAIVGKQSSVSAARTLLARLVQCLGQPIEAAQDAITHLFPTPEAIADADLEALGIFGMRRCAIQVIARGVRDHTIDFNESNEDVARTLSELPGVGRWIAGYTSLLGLGEPDALPYGDPILRQQASSRGFPLSAQELAARATRWRPFRGYAVFHLWEAYRDARLAALLDVRKQPDLACPEA
jgi:AraC family transcriptional regulator, regulatory protein of adaptative response / DNA-3-methyladenine glycosylase II